MIHRTIVRNGALPLALSLVWLNLFAVLPASANWRKPEELPGTSSTGQVLVIGAVAAAAIVLVARAVSSGHSKTATAATDSLSAPADSATARRSQAKAPAQPPTTPRLESASTQRRPLSPRPSSGPRLRPDGLVGPGRFRVGLSLSF